MKIVTGYTGTPHITSNDQQAFNQGVFGTGSYVLDVGQKFNATLNTATTVTIEDGEGMMQGVHFRIDPGETDTVTISPGTPGFNRIDLICARYTKDPSTGLEDVSLVIIEGVVTEGTATEPAYNTGDILSGDTVVDFPLYRISIAGVTPTMTSVIQYAPEDVFFDNIGTIINLGSYQGTSNPTVTLSELQPGTYIIFIIGTVKGTEGATYYIDVKNGSTTILYPSGRSAASEYNDLNSSAPLQLSQTTSLTADLHIGGENKTWDVSFKALRIL